MASRVLRFTVGLLGAIVIFASADARAAGPRLDPRFSGDGISETLIGGAQEVMVQKDRKIVVAGSTSCGGQGLDFGLSRFNADGSVDRGFGRRGRVCVDSGEFVNSEVRSAALQRDGKIVVAGGSAPSGGFGQTRVMRFTPQGRVDRSFARDGLFTRMLGDGIGSEFANGVAIDREGRIVLVGEAGRQVAVARLTPRGGLDRAFGDGGVTYTPTGLWTDVVVEPSGRIIAGGGTNGFEAAALTPRGRLDRGFGDQGLVEIDTGINRGAWDVDRAADGRLTLVGEMRIPESDDGVPSGYETAPAAVRLDSDGEPVRRFGEDGVAIIPIGTSNPAGARERQGFGLAVERQAGGATLIAAQGRYWNTEQNQYDSALTLIRLCGDGSPDPEFGTGGVVRTGIYAEPGLFLGSALDAKDRLLVGAWTADVARFLAP